jgi:hypothetical protein
VEIGFSSTGLTKVMVSSERLSTSSYLRGTMAMGSGVVAFLPSEVRRLFEEEDGEEAAVGWCWSVNVLEELSERRLSVRELEGG